MKKTASKPRPAIHPDQLDADHPLMKLFDKAYGEGNVVAVFAHVSAPPLDGYNPCKPNIDYTFMRLGIIVTFERGGSKIHVIRNTDPHDLNAAPNFVVCVVTGNEVRWYLAEEPYDYFGRCVIPPRTETERALVVTYSNNDGGYQLLELVADDTDADFRNTELSDEQLAIMNPKWRNKA